MSYFLCGTIQRGQKKVSKWKSGVTSFPPPRHFPPYEIYHHDISPSIGTGLFVLQYFIWASLINLTLCRCCLLLPIFIFEASILLNILFRPTIKFSDPQLSFHVKFVSTVMTLKRSWQYLRFFSINRKSWGRSWKISAWAKFSFIPNWLLMLDSENNWLNLTWSVQARYAEWMPTRSECGLGLKC